MLHNKVLINLLLGKIEDEEIIIDQVMTKEVHDMFQSRKKEGFFSILIEKHLFSDENNFFFNFNFYLEEFTYLQFIFTIISKYGDKIFYYNIRIFEKEDPQ